LVELDFILDFENETGKKFTTFGENSLGHHLNATLLLFRGQSPWESGWDGRRWNLWVRQSTSLCLDDAFSNQEIMIC